MGAVLLLSTPSRLALAEVVAERLDGTPETMQAWRTFQLIDGGILGRPRPVSEKTRKEAIFMRGMDLAIRNMCVKRARNP